MRTTPRGNMQAEAAGGIYMGKSKKKVRGSMGEIKVYTGIYMSKSKNKVQGSMSEIKVYTGIYMGKRKNKVQGETWDDII